MKEDKTIAESINDKLAFSFTKDVLIKPLEITKVKKQFEVPITDKKDKADGIDVNEYTKTKTETKEVDSNFQKGIVLAIPSCLQDKPDYAIGDTVVYPRKFAIEFDLFKNSVLVKPYDILAIITDK